MNTKSLRQKLLDLAIRGKLVPQDPNDEPAIELLRHINPNFIPPQYDEPLPQGWTPCKIGDLVNIISGVSYNKSNICSNGIRILRGGNIQDGEILRCSDDVFLNSKYYNSTNSVYKGDIVMVASTGSFIALGKTGYCHKDMESTQIGAFLRIIRAKDIKLSSFLNLLFLSDTFKKHIKNLAKGININNLRNNYITDYILPLPPLAEQKRIVREIERWFAYIDTIEQSKEALLEAMKRMRSKFLDLAIQGKLVPQDPNDEPAIELLHRINPQIRPITEDTPFDIPKSWRWCRIDDISNVCSARRVHKNDWRKSGIPFYRAREIGKLADNGYVDNELYIDKALYDAFSKSGVPQKGDLMITAVGTLGKVYIVQSEDLFYYKDASVICLQNKYSLCPKYLKHVIESPFFIGQYKQESQGTTVATLTMERFNKYLIPIPPLAEQQRIVARIEELFATLDKIQESVD